MPFFFSLQSAIPTFEGNEKVSKKEWLKSSNILLGLSSLVQKITDGKLVAAAFSNNLEPRFITRQIMTLAMHKRPGIMLVVVPNLEDLLENLLGIKSYTLGITEDSTKDQLSALCETFKEISSRFPTPVKSKNSKQKPTDEVTVKIPKRKKAEPLVASIDFDRLYLKKPTEAGKKAWTPSASHESMEEEGDATDKNKVKQWSDFISLKDDGDQEADNKEPEDLDEERVRLKALLLSSGLQPSTTNDLIQNVAESDEAMECDSEDKSKEPAVKKESIFLRPEETSGNQWGSLLKPENLQLNLSKQQKRKEKRQRRKEKKVDKDAVPFHPMKVHKVQPNPQKVKKAKKLKKGKK